MRAFLSAIIAFTVVLIIGAIIQYWYVVFAAVVLALLVLALRALYVYRRLLAVERVTGNDRIVAQADLQHAWCLAGDPRGIYGGTLEYARLAETLAQTVVWTDQMKAVLSALPSVGCSKCHTDHGDKGLCHEHGSQLRSQLLNEFVKQRKS